VIVNGDLASRIIVLTAVAFCLWIGLMWSFRRVHGRVPGLVAAALSWAGASASAAWFVEVLKHARFWPLV